MKRLIDYALNQPLFILLGTLLFVMAGVFAFKNLSVEAFPDVTDTQVTVISLYPGRAAEEVEKEVTLPIEVALSDETPRWAKTVCPPWPTPGKTTRRRLRRAPCCGGGRSRAGDWRQCA